VKKFISLFIASLLVGFACFAVFYWLVNWNWSDSLSAGMAAAGGGLVGEYLRSYFEKRKSKRVTEH
jgi:hypothetical protein